MMRSRRWIAANIADRALSVAASAVMLIAAWWPVTGQLPGGGFRVLATVASGLALAASFIAPRGSFLALVLLWAALGGALGLAVVGLFSIGFFYVVAAALIIAAIVATPNRSGLPRRFAARYLFTCAIAIGVVLLAVVVG
jgi:hypothetical protein